MIPINIEENRKEAEENADSLDGCENEHLVGILITDLQLFKKRATDISR